MHQQERFLSPLCFFFFLLVEAFFNSTACFAIFHWNITLHIALNLNEKPSKAASKKQQLGHLIPAALFVKNIAR